MAYTVYWKQNRPFTTDEWEQISESVFNMFNRLKQVKGGNGTGRPINDNSDIIFNGDASKGEDHETFQLNKYGTGFNFCKTARKPYDRYVKAVLVIANFYAKGALDVTCDGDSEPDCWTEGVRIATFYTSPYLGRKPHSPVDEREWDNMAIAKVVTESPYTDSFNEIDEAIELLEKISKGNKVRSFLANYLKANIDDIKDAYIP
jgi:hypothetical protein